MYKDRFEKFVSFVAEELCDTCPIYDADVDQKELPFCSEEYCLSYGGAECWKKWVLGETE